MFYLAIDQHSNQLTVDCRNEDGDPTLRRQVSTKWASVKAFLEKLARDTAPEGGSWRSWRCAVSTTGL